MVTLYRRYLAWVRRTVHPWAERHPWAGLALGLWLLWLLSTVLAWAFTRLTQTLKGGWY